MFRFREKRKEILELDQRDEKIFDKISNQISSQKS